MTSLLAVVGPAEPAGDHAAEVPARFEQRHLQPFTRGGDRGHHAAGRSAVDDEIELLRNGGGGAEAAAALCCLGAASWQRVRKHTDSSGHFQRILAAGREAHLDEERGPSLLRRRHPPTQVFGPDGVSVVL